MYLYVSLKKYFCLDFACSEDYFMRHNSKIDLTTFLAYVTFFNNTEKNWPKLLDLMLLERIFCPKALLPFSEKS